MSLLPIVVVGGFGPLAPPAHAQDDVHWAFKAGETLRYEFHQKNDIRIKSGAQEAVNTTDLTIEMTWAVEAITPEGTAAIALAVTRVRAEIQAGGARVHYDSRDFKPGSEPGAQALHDVYRFAVGARYRLRIDARGRVVEARVPDEVVRAVRGSPFVGVADGGSVLSEAGLKNMLAQVVPALPEAPRQQGREWQAVLMLPTTPLAMTLTFRYRLDALDAATAAIKADVETALTPEPGTPFKVAVKKQSGTASYLFDRKAGRLRESGVRQSITMALGFADNEAEQVVTVDEQFKLIP